MEQPNHRRIFLLICIILIFNTHNFIWNLTLDRSLQETNSQFIPMNSRLLKSLQSNETPYNQIWNRTWGGGTNEAAEGVAVDTNGSIYIAGGSGSSIMFLTKYNSSGEQLWNVTWGISGWDLAHAVTIDINNSVYVVGEGMSYSMGFEDAFLTKYNSNGTLLWNVTWGSVNQDMANAVAVDPDGFIYVAGRTDIAGFPTPNWDGFLLKFYPNGTRIWNYTWGGSGDDRYEGVALDSSGFIYATGSTGTFGNNGMLVKYAPNGTQLWNLTWGGGSSDGGNAIAISSDSSIYLAGYTNSFAIGGSDGILLKFDSNGTLLWNKTWGGGNDEYYKGIKVGSDGLIYTSGYTSSFGAGGVDATFVKYDSNGTLIWNQTWGGGGSDIYNDIAIDTMGFFYLAGYTNSFGAGGNDALIVKYLGKDSDGDGLNDILENFYGTNPNNPDTDNDGLLDGEEILTYNTNATNPDTDDDLIPDGWEVLNSLNPLNNDSLNDPDNDNLSNLQEYQNDCNPHNNDTDSDGLNDSAELFIYYTNATNPDTDSDGLNDSAELLMYYTNATNPDTDSDGLNDSAELLMYYTNATNPDTDSDGLNDSAELLMYYTNATNPDTDSDGLNDSSEIQTYNTNPINPDTDNDGLLDGMEVNSFLTNPLSNDTDSDTMLDAWEILYALNPNDAGDAMVDSDGDGLNNSIEFVLGTSPKMLDTDSDGYTDKQEFDAGTDPLDPSSYPGSDLTFWDKYGLLFIIIVGTMAISSILVVYTQRKYGILGRKIRFRVFISHAMADFKEYLIEDLAMYLKNQPGISQVYYCEEDLVGNIDDWMKMTVPRCQILILIATRRSLNSPDCLKEISLARKHNIQITPILGKDIEWRDLEDLNISRELGRVFNLERFDRLCKDLYNYIIKYKQKLANGEV